MATLYSEIFDLATTHYSNYEIDTLYQNSSTTCPVGVTYYSDTGLTTSVGTTSTSYTATYVNGDYSSISILSVTYYVATSDCLASNYDTYMTGFLIAAIAEFSDFCNQDLTDRSDTTFTFNITLTPVEIDILARLIAVQIIKKEVHDIRQIRGMVQNDSSASRYSEANLLKEKLNLQRDLIELANKRMTAYELSGEDWSTFYDYESQI